MNAAKLDHDTLRGAIELACRAPSIHNSQPWRWYLGDHGVHLYADQRRWLPATDADGRDLLLSCGAALHHLRVALAACELSGAVHRIPNPSEPDHLASVELHPARTPEIDPRLASIIPLRRTDRRPFSAWPVPRSFLTELEDAAAAQGAVLRVISGSEARSKTMVALREAAIAQAGVPGYETELALWTSRHASLDGIPSANLPRHTALSTQPARPFPPGELGDTGAEVDHATLLVLGTTSDDRLSRLRGGEALSAVLLHATDFGLATCPLSQPLEIKSIRRYLQHAVLDNAFCAQLIMRVGWAPACASVPLTPRRPADESIEPLPW